MMLLLVKLELNNYMETALQGKDGEETVTVDNLGKVLKIDSDTRVEPVAGNEVHLTIDSSWQSAVYQILKQRVAGILLSKIEATKTYDYSVQERGTDYRFLSMMYTMRWSPTV